MPLESEVDSCQDFMLTSGSISIALLCRNVPDSGGLNGEFAKI